MNRLHRAAGDGWRLAWTVAISALALATMPILAQQAPIGAQQPGVGAQVHTGTSSGLDTDARLRNLLADHQFQLIEAQLDAMAPAQAQFYRGILANRSNDAKTSIQLLEPLVEQVTASDDTGVPGDRSSSPGWIAGVNLGISRGTRWQ
jgi:hypothetical protein